jgi:hypothetical protein
MTNLPNTEEWRTFASTLEHIEKADTVASMVTHLLSFEANLYRARGHAPDAAQFILEKSR